MMENTRLCVCVCCTYHTLKFVLTKQEKLSEFVKDWKKTEKSNEDTIISVNMCLFSFIYF